MGYSIDPLSADCYQGTTCLINKLGITDERKLSQIETLITTAKCNDLEMNPIMGTIDPKMQTQNDSQVSDSSIGTEWSCLNCDTINTGKFCSRCGNPRPH